MNPTLEITTSVLTSIGRLGSGSAIGKLGPRPEKMLEVYEFEACPFCRKVREALSILDLDARILPCPKGGKRFREALVKRGGKAQFPYLVDPNTGVEMYESDDIVRYLFAQYGDGKVSGMLRMGPLNDLSAVLSGLPRGRAGSRVTPSREPEQPLELASFEASPFCRIVREKLCTLEIPYLLRNVAKGSPSRDAFEKRSGKMMVPWLSDPNTGTEMFESNDIVAYLQDRYAI
ncbi:MAG: glutathione S-transferase N-terminal domain-containing protein [Deltaproteobacteria bacterium]|nr:glutathione S-transferase N-terminal domain-containing protein [Deltaproteobacteria bacterium]MBW2292068.1 glutathione S-transferase N-terminal domain-containing protein [Deltaproteobacteria bacterium]